MEIERLPPRTGSQEGGRPVMDRLPCVFTSPAPPRPRPFTPYIATGQAGPCIWVQTLGRYDQKRAKTRIRVQRMGRYARSPRVGGKEGRASLPPAESVKVALPNVNVIFFLSPISGWRAGRILSWLSPGLSGRSCRCGAARRPRRRPAGRRPHRSGSGSRRSRGSGRIRSRP